MDKKIALQLNSVELLKHALFKDYAFPPEIGTINLTQERILMTIKNSASVPMVSISRAIGLEKGPFSQSVDKLESLGLVTRIRSATDRRLIHLELTESGDALTKVIEESMDKHFAAKLAVLTSDELDNLFKALNTINNIANTIISK